MMKTTHGQPKRGATGIAYGLLIGLIAVVALASIQSGGDSTNQLFEEVSDTLQGVTDETVATAATPAPTATAIPTPTATPTPTPRASCKAILDAGESTGDGVYTITLPGPDSFDVYCDMTSSGGGWTLVAHRQPSAPDTQVSTLITASTPGDVMTAARWTVLRDASTEMYAHDTGESYDAIIDVSKAKTANCGALGTDLTVAKLIHSETSGCTITGIDYCLVGVNGSRRNQLYRYCNSTTSFWSQPAAPSPTGENDFLLLYVR